MSNLTPRIYLPGSCLKVVAHNAYDTVHLKPIPNSIEEGPSIVHQQDVTLCEREQVEYALPLSDDVAPTFIRTMSNTWSPWWTDLNYAKARIEVTMVSGTVDITLNQPVVDLPTAELVLNGHSYVVDHLTKSYEDFPSEGSLNYSSNFPAWIRANGQEKNTLYRSYDTSEVSLNPWVNQIVAWTEENKATIPPMYVDVKFVERDDRYSEANWKYWSDVSTGNALTTGPYRIYTEFEETESEADNEALYMYDQKAIMKAVVIRLSDTRIRIVWWAPAKYAYMAASRKRRGITLSWEDIDNLAYLDVIDNITLVVKATKRNTETIDVSYSLGAFDRLSSEVKNNNIYDLESSEIFTLRTYIGTSQNNWAERLAETILRTSKDGKYIFECEVPATWAYENRVKVRSKFYIIQQDGTYVKRRIDGVMQKILFEVMNIAKYYSRDKFVYKLKLIQI